MESQLFSVFQPIRVKQPWTKAMPLCKIEEP